MAGNRSITDFFKNAPTQPVLQRRDSSAPISQSQSTRSQEMPPLESDILTSHTSDPDSQAQDLSNSRSSLTKNPSLSSPNHVSASEDTVAPETTCTTNTTQTSARVIKSSDDEASDSDTSIPELFPTHTARKSSPTVRPKTPPRGISKQNVIFHTSPLALLSKRPTFDMSSLIDHARKEKAAEESSKKVRQMLATKKGAPYVHVYGDGAVKKSKQAQQALLEAVVNEKDDGDIAKVTRALSRTEATVAENRFYFFDTHIKVSKPTTTPFPKSHGMRSWQKELKDPQIREQSFLSGFVEDMIILGKVIPDELFTWMLHEACSVTQETLRTSYFTCLRGCPEQLHRLLVPELLQALFQRLRVTRSASTTSMKISPTRAVQSPYAKHDWQSFRAFVQFLGNIGSLLGRESLEYTICIHLRMLADKAIVEKIDLFTEIQGALFNLTRDISAADWENLCASICKTLFETVPLPSLQFQIIDSIPSITERLHDLRRRLGMCYFFDVASYSTVCTYESISITLVLERLNSQDFDTQPQTDFVELAARILLLDVAVDDGRTSKMDLHDTKTEKRFNEDVDKLVASIKDIMTSIGNPGAAFISRIEAKEVLELVSQRIADTVRTKRLLKETWFDQTGKDEDVLSEEKRGMNKFLTRMKRFKEVN